MWFQTTTSETPRDAPADFASLPPLVAISDDSYHGSGFRLDQVLDRYALMSFDQELLACAACKSPRVRCIYLHYFHHQNESDVRLELVCEACGRFTHHAYWR